MADNKKWLNTGMAGPGEDFEKLGWDGNVRVLRRKGSFFLADNHHEGSLAFGQMSGLQVYEKTADGKLRLIATFEERAYADSFMDKLEVPAKAP
jgi:hypothetical protein